MRLRHTTILSLVAATSLTACGGGSSEKAKSNTQPDTTTTVNTAPLADAGEDINLILGDEVTLNGTKSSDADGDELSYNWTVESSPGASVELSPTASPLFTPSAAGDYEITLIVGDGTDKSNPDTVIVNVTAPNTTPIAAITGTSNLVQGERVSLSGETSTDANNDELTYSWALTDTPEGSQITTDDLEQKQVIDFTPDVPGTYKVRLIVNDGVDNSDPVTTDINVEVNNAPSVNAIIDLDFPIGGEAYIYSDASDQDGDELTYLWEITSAPQDSALTGFTGTGAYLTYIPDVPGTYTAKVTVSDGFNDVESDQVTATITAVNYRYSVGGGTQYFGKVDEPLLIDFATSNSPDGKALEYSWQLRSGPGGSRPSLTKSIKDNAETEFTANVPGDYRLFVTIQDPQGYGDAESVYIKLYDNDENLIPNAEVDTNHFIALGQSITLDGRGSSDFENDLVNYQWSVAYQPPGSELTISNEHAVSQTFNPSVPGFYNVQLRASDALSNGDAIAVGWFFVHEKITATHAFTDGEIYAKEGETITLNGTDSVGVTESMTIRWDLLTAPYNSSSEIVDAASLTPDFMLDADGKYVFQLSILDAGEVLSIEHLTVRATENGVPVADAGNDVTAISGETVTLSASQSSDPENDPLSYFWQVVGLSGEYLDAPAFTVSETNNGTLQIPADYTGEIVASLTVSDGEHTSPRDEVLITVNAAEPSAQLEKGITSPEYVDLPYDETVIVEPLADSPGDGVQILEIFKVYAENADLTIANTQFKDLNEAVEPVLEVISYDFSLPADEQEKLDYTKDITIPAGDFINMAVISPADTKGQTALIELSFDIVETGESVRAAFEFSAND